MTPEAQRIAIAEAHDSRTYRPGTGQIINGEPIWLVGRSPITCANYPADLNAMHEAEMSLPEEIDVGVNKIHRGVFRWWLRNVCKSEPAAWHATAAQRAEAFLRTIGKWQEIPTPPNLLAQVAELR